MATKPGYLLPDGECYTEELACAIVFYPDKPEYRRALLGSIVYLSTWLAWERDSAKRGKDAARAWKNAVDETVECWTMSCFEELIADVAAIRILMQNKKDCCDDNVTYFPTEEPTTEIVPLVGDPPAFYGETAITDWDDWSEHVCYNAHAYVDYLIGTSEELFNAVNVSSLFLGLISSALVLLAFSGIGLPIAFGLASWVVTGLALSATVLTFSSTADDFEDARDLIVCAIMTGGSLPDAVEAALGSGTDWDLFYQFVDYDAATAIIYEGGYGTEYLPEETRTDCVCEADELFVFEFPTDIDGFASGNLTSLWNVLECIQFAPNSDTGWRGDRWWTWTALASEFSFSLPVYFDQMRFKFYFFPGSGSMGTWEFYFTIYGLDDASYTSEIYHTDDYAVSEWHEIVWNLPTTLQSGVSNEAIYLRMYRHQPASAGQRVYMDNLGLYKK